MRTINASSSTARISPGTTNVQGSQSSHLEGLTTLQEDRKTFVETVTRRISEYTMMDDVFMTAVLDDNIPATQAILRVVLGKPDLQVLSQAVQERFQNLSGHSTVFDVYATDSEGAYYDIEIQNAASGASPRRARYHSAMIDSHELKEGVEFDRLNESYVIFITRDDVLGKNLPLYHIERVITESNETFSDGAHIVYVNGSYPGDNTALGLLIKDLTTPDPATMHFKELAEKAGRLKNAKVGVPAMSQFWEDVYQDAHAKGLALGIQEGVQQGLKQGLEQGLEQGIQEGILQGSVSAYAHSALSLVENLHIDMEAAIQALDIPEDLKESVITTTKIAAEK